MDPADRVDGQWDHMVDIAAHDPFEAVPQADDVYLFEPGADGRRPDDAVDAGGGPAADEDCKIVMVLHKSMIASSPTCRPAGAACRPSVSHNEKTGSGMTQPGSKTNVLRGELE